MKPVKKKKSRIDLKAIRILGVDKDRRLRWRYRHRYADGKKCRSVRHRSYHGAL